MQRNIGDLDWDSTCGNYMKAVDLPEGGATLTIHDVAQVEVRDTKARRDDAVKSAWAISWREDGWRPLILNTTLKKVLRALCGPTIGDAIGRQITIYNDQSVSLGRQTVGGVRILGAPWLDGDVQIEIQPNPRKRPERVTLRRTGPPARKAAAAGPVQAPDLAIADWAEAKGYHLRAVDAALTGAGKPRLGEIPRARHAAAIAWLEGEGKARLAAAMDADTTTTTDQTGD